MNKKRISRRYLLSVIAIIFVVGIVSLLSSIWVLYHSALETEKHSLTDLVQSHVHLIDAVAKFDADYSQTDHPEGAIGATLSQVKQSFRSKAGFGETGELVIGKQEGNRLVILFTTKTLTQSDKSIVLLNTPDQIAEPMRQALAGNIGTLIGRDYHGKEVLAAFMPSQQLGVGFVAKIELEEFRSPFIKASILAAGIATMIILLGALLIGQIEKTAENRVSRHDPFQLRSEVKPREWFVYRILLMLVTAISISSMSLWVLYDSSFSTARTRMLDMAEAQGALISAVARFDEQYSDKDYPGGAVEATLKQLRDAARQTPGFAQTGEFLLARYNGHNIEFLIESRHYKTIIPPVHMTETSVHAIQQALAGKTGSYIGKDYRDVITLSAYRPVPELNMGLVAKIDLTEIRAPFLNAGIISACVVLISVSLAGLLFWRLSMLLEPIRGERLSHQRYSQLSSLEQQKIPVSLIVFTFGLGGAFLALDLSLPLGIAGGVPYILFILLGKLFPRRRHTLYLALIATGLTWLGYLYSPTGGVEWMVEMNRALAFFAIWVTALTVSLTHAHQKALKLQAAELRKLSLAIENNPASVIITDPDGITQYVNRKFTELTGYRREEVIGQKFNHTRSGETSLETYQELWLKLKSGHEWRGEFHNRKKSGELYWEASSIHPLTSASGEILNYVALQEDITERKETEEQLRYMACHDLLTGLPTRNLCMDRLQHAMDLAQRLESKVAVLFVDLDGFKQVNDQYGHDIGDWVLEQTGERLSTCIRQADTVSRFGGDEFILVLSGLQDLDSAAVVARKVIQAIEQPFLKQEIKAVIGSSIGIAVYPDHASNAESLIQKADQAMYEVKHTGKNSYQFADSHPGSDNG